MSRVEHHRAASRSRWYIGCALSLLVFELGAWLTASTAYRHVWADAAWIVVDVLATVMCWQTARRARADLKLAWRCFTAAIGSMTLGMLVWGFYELVLGQLTPFPSIVDVIGWLCSPFLTAGIFFYKTRDRSRALSVKQIADLVLVVCAIIALAVRILYVPAIDASYTNTYVAAALTTPVIAVTATVFGLLTLWQHIRGPRRRVLATVVLGVALLAVSSVLYAEALLGGRYKAGGWIDAVWICAFLAFASAAREELLQTDDVAQEPERSMRLDPIVPAAALAVWMAAWLTSGHRDALLVINAITGGVLAVGLFVRAWAAQRVEAELAARVAREEARAWQLEARLARAHKLEAIGTLAGGVAHDFNNVLAAASAGLHLTRRKLERGQPVTKDLGDIEGVLFRAADLTGRLLDLARKREPKRIAIDPRDIIERVRVLLDKVVPSGVSVTVVRGDRIPAIVVDPSGLEHALLNLGLNARDALRGRGGTITMRVHRGSTDGIDGDAVSIEVTDDGTGIPADVLPRVFEPFFTTKAEEGTGLGLAMVEAFVSANGGVASVTSVPGNTTFRLAFPAAAAPATAVSVPAPTATVLVISREDATVLATAGVLERGGIAAVIARDATTAVAESARIARIDAILVDASSGDAGRDALRELREAGVLASSVLLIAPGGDDTGEWGAVLRKPYEPHDLVEVVQRAIATTVAGAQPPR